LKIGVLSDTHGDLYGTKLALEVLKDTDLIIHCGDLFYHGLFNKIKESYNPLELSKVINNIKKPLIFSKGNCDSEVDQLAVDFNILDPVRIYFYENNIVYIHHGDKVLDKELLDLRRKFKFNFVLSGHTHIYRLEKVENVLFMNPGSPSLPKGGNPPSVGIINFNENEAQIINIEKNSIIKEINLFD
jgi:hypothetical protein